MLPLVNPPSDSATRPPHPPSPPAPRASGSALNLPNAITLLRFGLALVLFLMIGLGGLWISSAVVFLVAALTDYLDGYFARKYGQITLLGRILDPFVDKVIVLGAFVFLATRPDSGVTAWMVVAVLARELFVTSLRGVLEEHGFDFSANWSGKLKMVVQCLAITVALLLLSPRLQFEPPLADTICILRDGLLWTMTAITLHSGLIYISRARRLLDR